MKLLKTFYLSVMIILASSCHESDSIKKENKVLIDLTLVNAQNFAVVPDLWLMATDKNGNLLASKHWQQEPTLELKGDVASGENINIVIFGASDYSDETYYHTIVYANVAPGRNWYIGSPYQLHTVQGQASVEFGSIPTLNNIMGFSNGILLSGEYLSRFGEIGPTNGSGSATGDTWTLGGSFTFYDNHTDIFFSYLPGIGTPTYLQTDTLRPNKTYHYNYVNAFKPFDHTIQLGGTAMLYTHIFAGGLNGEKHFGQGAYDNNFIPSVTIGYNSGFDNYFFSFRAFSGDYSYEWSVLTPAPTNDKFLVPQATINVADNSMDSFKSTISIAGSPSWAANLECRNSIWEVDWTAGKNKMLSVYLVSGELTGGKFLADGLPADIFARYPEVKDHYNKMQYVNSQFIFNDDGRTYGEHADKLNSEEQITEWRSSYAITR